MKAKPVYYKETIHNEKRRAVWHNYNGSLKLVAGTKNILYEL